MFPATVTEVLVFESSRSSSSSSGRASARASKVVTSFLFGLRRRGFVSLDFVTFERRLACFMRRLSFLLVGKSGADLVDGFEWALEVGAEELFCLRLDFEGSAVLEGRGRRGAMLLCQSRICFAGSCRAQGRC